MRWHDTMSLDACHPKIPALPCPGGHHPESQLRRFFCALGRCTCSSIWFLPPWHCHPYSDSIFRAQHDPVAAETPASQLAWLDPNIAGSGWAGIGVGPFYLEYFVEIYIRCQRHSTGKHFPTLGGTGCLADLQGTDQGTLLGGFGADHVRRSGSVEQ